jgi:hypothetical protein
MLDNLLGTRLILQQNWLGPETNFLNLNTELFQVQGSSSVFEKLAWNGSYNLFTLTLSEAGLLFNEEVNPPPLRRKGMQKSELND